MMPMFRGLLLSCPLYTLPIEWDRGIRPTHVLITLAIDIRGYASGSGCHLLRPLVSLEGSWEYLLSRDLAGLR